MHCNPNIRIAGCLLGVALLSACASKPRISAEQESKQYLSRAGRHYTAPGPASDPWGPYIREAAAKYDVPDRWIREVMRQESGGNLYNRNGDLITSGAGAMGLMQVMPGTYDDLRARYRELGDDPFDPHNNILAGTAYIREMYDIYGSPGFLAAYNAGPGRLDDYLTSNRTLPAETRRYVANISPRIAGSFPSTPSPGQQYAMNAIPFESPDSARYSRGDGRTNGDGRYSNSPAPYVPPSSYRPGTAIVLNPAPYAPPAPALSAPIQVAQLPDPPRLAPMAPAPVRVALLPEPPRYVPQPSQQFAAASALVPLSPPRSAFALISPANAAPIQPHRGAFAPGAWAVQVGAFANQNMASAATAAARGHAPDVLGGAHTNVASVRQPHGVLYRARLTGLSRDAAAHACERLARARTNCMVVSPDAQS